MALVWLGIGMEDNIQNPVVLHVIAWLWVVGALWKLSMIQSSWHKIELWRNLFLRITKSLFLVSSVLLLLGYKQSAFISLIMTISNTLVFYLYQTALNDLELYFTTHAITLTVAAPIVFMSILLFTWNALR
jgi:hypothetical protein